MAQIDLPLQRRIAYSKKSFIQHNGVSPIWSECAEALTSSKFGSWYTFGPSRSGKTHLAVALSAEAMALKLNCTFWDGEELFENLPQFDSQSVNSNSLVVIDDVDRYLARVEPGQSGAFVNFFQAIRNAGGKLIMCASVPPEALPCDDHIQSRLKSSRHVQILHPTEADLPRLIKQIAYQRGLTLDDRKSAFLLKRVGRDIAGIEFVIEKIDAASRGSQRLLPVTRWEDALSS